MLPRLTLLILLCFSAFPATGQENCEAGQSRMHRIAGSDFMVQVPPGFQKSAANSNEFVYQEKGSVLKFARVENIPVNRFCDSLTTSYFTAQGLRDVQQNRAGQVRIYSGLFEINKVPYVRTFYIRPQGNNTIVGIANFPAALRDEFEEHFVTMLNTGDHD